MTVHIKTRVLPGNRVEITAAGLHEGEDVEVTIKSLAHVEPDTKRGILDYIDSLPPTKKSSGEWAEYERQFQEERDSWGR